MASAALETESEASSTRTVRIACREIDAADLHTRAGPKCVHYKGFAKGIRQPPSDAMLTLLLEYDTIAFDGDAFARDSFTAAIPLLVAHAATRKMRIPTFVAFKYASGAAEVARWQATYDIHGDAGSSPEWYAARARTAATAMETATEGGSDIPTADMLIVLLDKATMETPATAAALDNKFLDLGLHALSVTKARDVVCWGGGAILQLEYTHQPHRAAVTWHAFPCSRMTADGRVEHGALETVIHDRVVQHPH